MITGRVINYNTSRRLIDVACDDTDRTVKGMYVSEEHVFPGEGGIIYGDETRKIVLAILAPGKTGTGEEPLAGFLKDSFSAGDWYRKTTGAGVMGLFRKLGAFLGSGPDNILIFNGLAKSLEVLTSSITINSSGFNLLVESLPHSPGKALMNFKVGNLIASIDPEKTMLSASYGSLSFQITPSDIQVFLLNPETQKRIKLLSWTNKEGSSQMQSSIDDLAVKLKDLSLSGKTLSLDFSGLGTISADTLKLIAVRSLSILAQNIHMAASKIEVDGGSVVFNTGTSPKPGDFHVNNGPLSFFRVGNKNDIKMFAMKSMYFNGSSDNLASGQNTKQALTQLNMAIQTLAGFIGALPGGQPVGGTCTTQLQWATAYTQMVKIKHLKCGNWAVPSKP